MSFSQYHPFVLMLYFISVIVLAMFTFNPVMLAIALISSVCCYAVLVKGRNFGREFLIYSLLFLLIALTNPLFVRGGDTVLFHIRELAVTLESLQHGFAAAMLLMSVIYWFKCYNEVMTSEKFMYLFGRVIPKTALTLTVAIRFVPSFKRQMTKINAAQKTLGLYASDSRTDKLKNGIRVLSAMTTWALENSVHTAESMNARGYELKEKTNFSLFKLTTHDIMMAVFIFAATAFVMLQASPVMLGILMFMPLFIEIWENMRWKYLISKI